MKKILIFLLILIVIISILLILGKKHVSTDIVIHAPAHKVWAVLTDFNSYPEWNPFIKTLSGEMKTGNTIVVTLKIPGSDPMVFKPEILQYEENRILQWQGRLFIPGIFTGRHTFQLVKIDDAGTKLLQQEDFSGILVPFFNLESTISGFQSMNNELKRRTERHK